MGGVKSQGVWGPLVPGKDKKVESSLKPLEGKQPCEHPDVGPVRPISDF